MNSEVLSHINWSQKENPLTLAFIHGHVVTLMTGVRIKGRGILKSERGCRVSKYGLRKLNGSVFCMIFLKTKIKREVC